MPQVDASAVYDQKWLVTGGTGFFGRALLRHWIAEAALGVRPPAITVLTRSPEYFLKRHPEFFGHEWLRFTQGDILEPLKIDASQFFTHVLHAATDSTLGPQLRPLERYQQIVDGTRNTLNFAVQCGASRFLLTSSGGVYGSQPQDMEKIPETYNGMPDPLRPEQTYSVAKRVAEHLCALYQEQYGIETVIARCFTFVGQDLPLDVHFAIGNFIRDALKRSEIVVNGDGAPVRSYMDQRDLAIWLTEIMQRGHPGFAYNVGSDQAISIARLAYLVRDTLSPGLSVRISGNPSRSHTRNCYIPSIEKAQTELNLILRYPLTDALLEVGAHLSL
jgi:UDP-glucuronate decarboxylase